MDLVKDLPEIFDNFSEARKNGFIQAKELNVMERELNIFARM